MHLTSVHEAFDTRIFLKECHSLARAGYEVLLVAPHDADVTRDGVRIVAVPRPKGRLERATRTAWRVFRMGLALGADVYHLHDPELLPHGLLLKLMGKRVIYDAHENLPKDVPSKHYPPAALRGLLAWCVDVAERAVCFAFDGIVTVTPGIAVRFPYTRTVLARNYPLYLPKTPQRTATAPPLKGGSPRRVERRTTRQMRKQISLLLLVLVILAFFPYPDPAQAADIKTDLSLSTGYRVDDLRWNIAGNVSGTNPNVLSELTWSDLETLQATVSGRALVHDWLYLRGSLGYGWTFSGGNLDSDFLGNNRTQEYSRSSNSADGSRVLDGAIGLGYQFSFLSDRFRLSPLLGYSYSAQNLTLCAVMIGARRLTRRHDEVFAGRDLGNREAPVPVGLRALRVWEATRIEIKPRRVVIPFAEISRELHPCLRRGFAALLEQATTDLCGVYASKTTDSACMARGIIDEAPVADGPHEFGER